MAARIAIIAITTRSSMSVNAFRMVDKSRTDIGKPLLKQIA
jgi:hypothetical protein